MDEAKTALKPRCQKQVASLFLTVQHPKAGMAFLSQAVAGAPDRSEADANRPGDPPLSSDAGGRMRDAGRCRRGDGCTGVRLADKGVFLRPHTPERRGRNCQWRVTLGTQSGVYVIGGRKVETGFIKTVCTGLLDGGD